MKKNNYVCSPYATFKAPKHLAGSQIGNLYKARDTANELTSLVENLPSWIFEEGEAALLLNSLTRTIIGARRSSGSFKSGLHVIVVFTFLSYPNSFMVLRMDLVEKPHCSS